MLLFSKRELEGSVELGGRPTLFQVLTSSREGKLIQ